MTGFIWVTTVSDPGEYHTRFLTSSNSKTGKLAHVAFRCIFGVLHSAIFEAARAELFVVLVHPLSDVARAHLDLICVYWFSYRNRCKPYPVYISGLPLNLDMDK